MQLSLISTESKIIKFLSCRLAIAMFLRSVSFSVDLVKLREGKLLAESWRVNKLKWTLIAIRGKVNMDYKASDVNQFLWRLKHVAIKSLTF